MNVALFDGKGFIGSYILDELVRQGHHPILLVRPGSEYKIRNRKDCTIVTGTISHPNTICDVLSRCETAIYNIGIIREFPRKGITYDNLHFTGARSVIDCAHERPWMQKKVYCSGILTGLTT